MCACLFHSLRTDDRVYVCVCDPAYACARVSLRSPETVSGLEETRIRTCVLGDVDISSR